MNRLTSRIAVAAAFGTMLTAAVPAFAEVVGTTGAANTRATGTPPGGSTRTIQIGTQVVHNEKIETSASGSLHIIFVDKTTLNVGPSSTLVINEYVYNPASGTGQMAATLTKGVMRIVGGQVTHTGGAQIKTPAATIGVRGGVATIRHCASVGPGCSQTGTRAVNHYGVLTATTGGGTETISRPGFGTFVPTGGSPPTPPGRVTQGEIDLNNRQLTSQGGERGGNGAPPSDAQGARAGLGQTNGNAQTLIFNPFARPQPPALSNSTLDAQTGQQQTAANNAQSTQPSNSNQQTGDQQTNNTPDPTPTPTPTPDPPAKPTPARAYVLTTTAGAGSRAPYLTASFAGRGKFTVSPIYAYKPEGTNASRLLQANLSIRGEGRDQTSALSVMTGVLGAPAANTDVAMAGNVEASAIRRPGRLQSRATGSVSSTNAAGTLSAIPTDSDGVPTGPFTTSQNQIGYDSTSGFQVQLTTASDRGRPYSYVQTVAPGTSPANLGSDHPEQILSGFAAGLARTTTIPVNGRGYTGDAYIVSNDGGRIPSVSISMFADGRLTANFQLASYAVSRTGEVSILGGDRANMLFGSDGTSGQEGSRGTYVDSRIFGALGAQAVTTAGGRTTISPSSTVLGNALKQDGLMLVSSDAVNAASFFPKVKFCVCDYTRWGFWSMNTEWIDSANGGATAQNTGHLMTWVAGLPTRAVDMPTTGTATYNGHVIANMTRSGTQYLAASNMTSTVNFGAGSASMSVANLDGYRYAGAITGTSGPIQPTFQFSMNGSAVSRHTHSRITPVMSVNGGFFASASSPAGSMAGAVAISTPAGQNYMGAGIFAAQK